MNSLKALTSTFLALLVLAAGNTAWAAWELDSTKSALNFISIKNDSVGEVHSFTTLVGSINDEGSAQLTIELDSVETLIDIRNERMREMLFETVKFPAATVSAEVDPALLASAAEGDVVTMELPVTLSLHGQEKTLRASVVVVGEPDGRLRVFSAHPVLINAEDFGLGAGVQALQKVAGLQAISNAVPVSLYLLFAPAGN